MSQKGNYPSAKANIPKGESVVIGTTGAGGGQTRKSRNQKPNRKKLGKQVKAMQRIANTMREKGQIKGQVRRADLRPYAKLRARIFGNMPNVSEAEMKVMAAIATPGDSDPIRFSGFSTRETALAKPYIMQAVGWQTNNCRS